MSDALKVEELWARVILCNRHVTHEQVHEAERAFIKHGLAEEYGRQLAYALWPTEPEPRFSFARALAEARTASPEVCVRAMAAVIEELEAK